MHGQNERRGGGAQAALRYAASAPFGMGVTDIPNIQGLRPAGTIPAVRSCTVPLASIHFPPRPAHGVRRGWRAGVASYAMPGLVVT